MSFGSTEEHRRRLEVKRRTSREEAEARLAEILELTLAADGGAWIDAVGWSMFPTSPPRSLLHVVARGGPLEVGTIAVFALGRQLVAHRLVSRGAAGWIAKGDGTPAEDSPLSEDQILGVVDGIRLAGRSWEVGADARVAAASRRLGGMFDWRGTGRAAAALGRAFYLVAAMPGLLSSMMVSWLKGRR